MHSLMTWRMHDDRQQDGGLTNCSLAPSGWLSRNFGRRTDGRPDHKVSSFLQRISQHADG